MGRCSDARDRLLCAATRLIHERGYAAVSVAEICAAAGVQKGSFYHFFPSKKDLVLVALDYFEEHYRSTLAQAMDPALSGREQIRRMTQSMGDALVKSHAKDGSVQGCPVGNLALEMASRDDDIRARLDAIFGIWRDGIANAIRRASNRGELHIGDPDMAAEAFVASIQGALLLAKAANDPNVFVRVSDQTLMMLEAVQSPTPEMQPSPVAPA